MFLACGAALAFAGTASASPPVLTSVGHISGHPTATWTIPPGGETWVVQIATSPAAGSDGDFFLENVVIHQTFFDQTTSWTDSGYPLQPGTYYVHVSAEDEPCYYAGGCPVYEWSNILTLTMPGNASPPSTSPPTEVNEAPRLSDVGFRLLLKRPGKPYRWVITMRACDDGVTQVRLHVRRNGFLVSNEKHRLSGCVNWYRRYKAPRKFKTGVLRVSVTLFDGQSESRRFSKTWRVK